MVASSVRAPNPETEYEKNKRECGYAMGYAMGPEVKERREKNKMECGYAQ